VDRLVCLYKSASIAHRFRYRAEYAQGIVLKDVFDGQLYKELVAEGLFANDTDVALAFSTDGFKATVKGVDKKLSTKAPEGWPFVCFNLNEPPAQRVKLCNVFFQGIKLTKMTKQNKTKQNKTKQNKTKKKKQKRCCNWKF